MTPRIALVVLSLLIAPVVGVPQALAAAASCHGRPATIVSDGGIVRGTQGPDVIVVTEPRVVIRARSGDDLICVSGTVNYVYFVDAGPGNDLVDTSASTGIRAEVILGGGSDRFIGGPLREMVWGSDGVDQLPDTEVDVFDTGEGADRVYTGSVNHAGSDVIRTGPGADLVMIEGYYAGVRLDVGAGRNQVMMSRPSAGSDPWHVDAAARTIQQGAVSWHWQGPVVSFSLHDDVSDLSFAGSTAGESLVLNSDGPRARIAMSEGDDVVVVLTPPADGSSYSLGGGDDSLSVRGRRIDGTEWIESFLHVDLAAHLLFYEPQAATPAATVRGVEAVTAGAALVRVDGSEAAETIVASGCQVLIAGGAGPDLLERHEGPLGNCPSIRSRLVGGPGADTLIGSNRLDDVLLGGAGRDVADGQHGDDRCVAEVVRHCER